MSLPTLTPADTGIGGGADYATPEQAIAAGADSTDPEALAAAIHAATIRVETWSGVFFTPRVGVQRVAWDAAGIVRSPAMPVLLDGTEEWLWVRASGSREPIQWWTGSAVAYGGPGSPVGGSRPGPGDGVLRATWGWPSPPEDVQRATARLAALFAPVPFQPMSDAEGNPVARPPVTPVDDLTDPAPPRAGWRRSTGDPVADALLDPHRHTARVG